VTGRLRTFAPARYPIRVTAPDSPPDPLAPTRFTRGRCLVAAGIATGVVAFLLGGPGEGEVIARSGEWRVTAGENLPLAISLFVLTEVILIALSLPVSLWLTVLAGFLFGAWVGAAVASVASTTGAVLAFVAARYAVAGPVRRAAIGRPRLARALARIDRGVAAHGVYYVAVLRMTPVFPFWLVNLGLALTPIRLRAYAVASWLATLPVAVVLASAGAELAEITSFRNALSWRVLLILTLMPLAPVIGRQLLIGRTEKPG
jgi:uncharacterized membrane protein YdjX (TVP38/TMEM64 family)